MIRSVNAKVLICGAGPTGLVAAIKLVRGGIDVDIVDSRNEPSKLSKAAAVWRRTLEVLHDDVPASRFVERGRVLKGIHVAVRDRILRTVEYPPRKGCFPTGLLIPQAQTEEVLIDALKDLGVEVRRGVTLTGFQATTDGVQVELDSGNGEERAEYEWLLGADGAGSRVRHRLGVDFPGSTDAQRWLLGDLNLEDPGDEDWMTVFFSKEGLSALFPYGGGRWRIVADGGPVTPDTPRKDPTLAEMESILRSRTGIRSRIESTTWLSEFRINERIVDSYHHGRVLLLGDAAHIHSPIGGQGMNTSIQDAVNLGWKLAMVVRGEADESLLATYQDERHQVGKSVVKATTLALKFAEMTNPIARFIRVHVVPKVMALRFMQRKLIDATSEVGINYRHGPLDDRGDRWIGKRLPELPLVKGEAVVYESIDTRGFTVLTFDENSFTTHGSWDKAIAAAGPAVRILRTKSSDAEASPLRHALKMKKGEIAVVRPDTYLGPVTSDPDRVVRWFEALRGRG